jgi:mannitol-1-phosphate/altronate dehydrogenase
MNRKLSLSGLNELPPGVARPAYRREQLSPGIVHIGTGNFHRAHQAVYLDDLFRAAISTGGLSAPVFARPMPPCVARSTSRTG